jgi:dTDP-4-dehydrorhamnose reductase
VVGGDSLVGGGLVQALSRRGNHVYSSTRREASVGKRRVFLDFESEETFKPPHDVGYAFIVAAATNYDRCEKDPLAHKINVELIPKLITSLLEAGIFVTFVSTNSVFGGERPWPQEEDPHSPGIAYAVQKDKAEKVVQASAKALRAEQRLNIVRLTKILDRKTPPLPNWFEAWQLGEAVQPFSDLIFAPMSVQFASKALAVIGEQRVTGELHLSGAENVSYVEFASALALAKGIDPRLVSPTTANAKGIHIAYKPRFSGLGMRRTTTMTGIHPQTLTDVVSDLCALD